MKFRLSLAVLLGVFVWAFAAYPDCHDTADCEDVEEYVVGDYYWGTHEETYRYYIDPDKSGMPSLTADVDAAADNWDRILFKGARLNFATHNKGRTTRDAGVEDGVNVISWEDLGDEDDDPLGLAYRWAFIGTYLLKEVDIAFNYYHDWATHANRQSGKYCIRNTATHEMGHAAGLDDVYYYPANLLVRGTVRIGNVIRCTESVAALTLTIRYRLNARTSGLCGASMGMLTPEQAPYKPAL